MIKADFHMHTSFSHDSLTSPERLVARCLEIGLGCIAVTDHNTIQGSIEVAKIAPFPVIIGAEIRSTGGEITGLFLHEEIPKGLTPLETIKRIKAQGGLVSIPHPFSNLRASELTDYGLNTIVCYADIIEVFNARNTSGQASSTAQQFALAHSLLPTAVSDAHHPAELGRTYTEMPTFDGTPRQFKQALSEARLVGKAATPLVHLLSTYAKIYKRLKLFS